MAFRSRANTGHIENPFHPVSSATMWLGQSLRVRSNNIKGIAHQLNKCSKAKPDKADETVRIAAGIIKKVEGVPQALTRENIEYLLWYYNTDIRSFVSSDSPEVEDERDAIDKRTKLYLKNLPSATTLAKAWDMPLQFLKDMNIAKAYKLYEINQQWGELHLRAQTGMERTSRYDTKWGFPRGEKAQVIFINKLLSDSYMNAKVSSVQRDYLGLKKRVEIYHFNSRKEWKEFGLTREVLRAALIKGGLSGIQGGFLSGIFGNKHASELTGLMTSTVMDKLCFTDELLGIYLKKAFDNFINNNNISDMEELSGLHHKYEETLSSIKKTIKGAIHQLYSDADRINISRDTLTNLGIKGLYEIMNNVRNGQELFETTVLHFSEALHDLEKDRIEMGLDSEDDPALTENFYWAISHPVNRHPIALVLCTNQKEIAEKKIDMPLFGNMNRENVINAIVDNNNPTAMQIEARLNDREREKEKKSGELQVQISSEMIDTSKYIKERISDVVQLIQKMLTTNGEIIKVTAALRNEKKTELMDVIASTDEQVLGKSIDATNDPDNLIAWANKEKKDIFVYMGKVFLNGVEVEIDSLDISQELKKRLGEITKNIDDTFILVPLISGGEVLGVISVKGARLTAKEMNNLKAITNNITAAVRADIEDKEKDEANRKLSAANFKDGLTHVNNRKYFDSMYPALFNRALAQGEPLSFLFIDLDGLKPFDDRDHKAGDFILESVAAWMTAFLKSENHPSMPNFNFIEYLSRYGGDEFVLPLIGMDARQANDLALKLSDYIKKQRLQFTMGEFSQKPENYPGYQFSLSIGISEYRSEMKLPDELIAEADKALYWKKRKGKKGVCVASPNILADAARMKHEEDMLKEAKEKARNELYANLDRAEGAIDQNDNGNAKDAIHNAREAAKVIAPQNPQQ